MDCNVNYSDSRLFLCIQFSRHECIAWNPHRINAVSHVFSRYSSFHYYFVVRSFLFIFIFCWLLLLYVPRSSIAAMRRQCVKRRNMEIDRMLSLVFECLLFKFAGTCAQSGMPNIDFMPISQLNLIQPIQIHICMWIYCSISTLWLISSITLLTSMLISIQRFLFLLNLN